MPKRYFLLFFMLLTGGQRVQAQGYRIVYLENELKKPFYVRFQEQLLSSTAEGYLIIPKVAQDTITLTIGFPKNTRPAATYQLAMQGKDVGVIIREVDSMNWGIYDHRTSALIPPQTEWPYYKSEALPQTDRFSSVLAQVSNTPELNEKWIAVQHATDSSKLPRLLNPPTILKNKADSTQVVSVHTSHVISADTLHATLNSSRVSDTIDLQNTDTSKSATEIVNPLNLVTVKNERADSLAKVVTTLSEPKLVSADSINSIKPVVLTDTSMHLSQTSATPSITDSTSVAILAPQDTLIVKENISSANVLVALNETGQGNYRAMDSITSPALHISSDGPLSSDSTIVIRTVVTDSAKSNGQTTASKTDTLRYSTVVSSDQQSPADKLLTDSSFQQLDTINVAHNLASQKTDTAIMIPIDTASLKNQTDTVRLMVDSMVVERIKGDTIQKQVSDTVVVMATLPSGCARLATADQVWQLKKKLRLQDNERLMLLVAKDELPQACFTVAEIKEMALFFRTEETRFRFLEMAVDRLSDKGNGMQLLDIVAEGEFRSRLLDRLR